MRIELNTGGCEHWEQTDEGWYATVVAYAPADGAHDDQTIDGSGWERDGDQGYACLTVSGPGEGSDDALADALDELVSKLEADGYEVEELQ